MNDEPPFVVVFFQLSMGREPVRDWLRTLDKNDCKGIGGDIKFVQYRWPLGMPLVRKLEPDLWEVRSDLSGNRIARVLFTVHGQQIALLHGFIKKSAKAMAKDIDLGRARRDLWHSEW